VTGSVNEPSADGQAVAHLLDAVTLPCGAESELMRSGRHDLRRFSVPAEVSCHAEGAGPPR
jgi:hypothetical protein